MISKYPSLDRRKNTRLPEAHFPAHELCFTIHDIMVQIIFSGRHSQLFSRSYDFLRTLGVLDIDHEEVAAGSTQRVHVYGQVLQPRHDAGGVDVSLMSSDNRDRDHTRWFTNAIMERDHVVRGRSQEAKERRHGAFCV